MWDSSVRCQAFSGSLELSRGRESPVKIRDLLGGPVPGGPTQSSPLVCWAGAGESVIPQTPDSEGH